MILWSCYSHLRQWIVPIMYLLMFWAQFRRCFLENNLWWSKNKHLKHPLRQTFLIFHHHCRETIFVEAILTRYHKCLRKKETIFYSNHYCTPTCKSKKTWSCYDSKTKTTWQTFANVSETIGQQSNIFGEWSCEWSSKAWILALFKSHLLISFNSAQYMNEFLC